MITNQADMPAPTPTPHRTPLRRVSQGSLLALSHSGAHHQDAPHGLGFLEPVLAELADEAETLRGNVDGLRALSASLDTFNEAFSSWLYVMNMNALTVDWPEVRSVFPYYGTSFVLLLSSHRPQRKRLLYWHNGGPVRSHTVAFPSPRRNGE
jgi:hypothetical protein